MSMPGPDPADPLSDRTGDGAAPEAFDDAHGYYTTLGHETVHWTRHPSRLDRSFGRERWGDEGYAREELVAEVGAAFLAADLGLALEPRPDHAAYIGHWIKVLQNDHRAIVSGAAHAERAHPPPGCARPMAARDWKATSS